MQMILSVLSVYTHMLPTYRAFSALVPGCGRGYDLVSLGSDDRFVVGLEISPTAVEAVKQYLESKLYRSYV